VAATAAIGLVAAAGCAGAPRGAPTRDAVVVLRSNVDAQIFVDGRFVAPISAARAGVAMEPGPRRVELRREGYFSRYLELALRPAERRVIELPLAPILP
jgi:hypothetical protein